MSLSLGIQSIAFAALGKSAGSAHLGPDSKYLKLYGLYSACTPPHYCSSRTAVQNI